MSFSTVRWGCLTLLVTSLVGCAEVLPSLLNQASIMTGVPAGTLTGGRDSQPSNTASVRRARDGRPQEAEGVPSMVSLYMGDVGRGQNVDLNVALKQDISGSSEALARLERGRIAHLQSDFQTSVAEFDEAIELAQDFEDRATVSISRMFDQIASIAVNDTLISYEPAAFERVMMYHFQAINYLAQGDLEKSAVEVRRANDEQERALKAHEAEVAEAQKAASSSGVSMDDLSRDVYKALGKSRAVASAVKNSFQNAYTFYMSGVVHELLGEPNDAYIDYKKALEIAPKNSIIQRDVARLATQLEMVDDIERFKKEFRGAFGAVSKGTPAGVDVVVLFEDGLVPIKHAITLPLPVPGVTGVTAFAIPTYRASQAAPQPLVVASNGAQLGKTERICAIDALAVKDYEEKAPAMILRQILRTAAKGGATYAAGHYGGTLGSLAASTYAVVSEVADTRSWQSLPQNAQVTRFRVKEESVLQLNHRASGAKASVTVPKGAKSFVVRASRVGPKLMVASSSF